MNGLFQGLGLFSENYTIPLREDGKPYSTPTPRHIPIIKKTQRELKRWKR